MRRRLFATLVLVACFAALPAWFLSTREGWITLDCARAGDRAALDCSVAERFAFGSRTATYSTIGARARDREQRDRRGSTTSYQLVLVTPAGEQLALRDETGNAELRRVASELDAKIRSHAAEFHAVVSPDLVFWFAVALLAVFASAGLFIAWVGGARARAANKRTRAPGAVASPPPRARVVRDDRGDSRRGAD